ncbi:diphthine--ammonia ligase [Candidatus Nanosalina sp. VS9-1]|uniref:diphthine--ammonia ligase n=1 Tax=Candidatus Nanosalina sp. VS9-1 TaxID=3388566 RepID=UPI0039E14481
MCGITGAREKETVKALNRHLKHRGQSCSIEETENFSLGHYLHSVVGTVEQPLEEEGLLSANCEIYNWKELNRKYGWDTENDAETLLKLLEKKGVKGLKEIDGIYAFAYLKNGEIILARDRLGVNPIWYSEKEFAFASEKQALEKEGFTEIKELHPRQILVHDLESQETSFRQREFFEITADEQEKVTDENIDETAEQIKEIFLKAVEKRVPEGDVGLLFSGGLDSTLVAAALQELDKDFTAYTAGIQHGNVSAPRDYEKAHEVAEKMGFPLERYEASLEEVEKVLPDLVDWISTTNVVKLGVALPFHFSLAQKNQASEQVVFTGFGSEQLYAGYARQQGYLNKECLSDLRGIFHEDLYRDNVVSFRNGRELRVPFLDEELVEYALSIPEDMKRTEEYRKYVLRKAAEKLGVPEDVAWRKKVAAQYGSNFDKAVGKLAKNSGFDQKQKYVNQFREKPNKKLVALTSGGKDSNAALFRMWRRNNEISCLLTLRSENKASYMFDSKKSDKDLEWQSEKLGIPLITQETKGEKEKELEDLRKGLEKAKEKFDVEGVVAGAIESSYQRDRVDKVAEEVGLKVFTPLWQFDQKQYMHWLVREGFDVKITDVAARGLSEDWEGKVLDKEGVEDLLELADEYRFHPAGEGGEYETKVVGFPEELVD